MSFVTAMRVWLVLTIAAGCFIVVGIATHDPWRTTSFLVAAVLAVLGGFAVKIGRES